MRKLDVSEAEKLFSRIYKFKYVLFRNYSYMNYINTDFNIIFNHMKIFDSKIAQNHKIRKYFIEPKLSKLPINLTVSIFQEDMKCCEVSERFGPKIIFDYYNKNVYIPENSVSESDMKDICEKLESFFKDIYLSLTMLDSPNLKTIKDVKMYFTAIDKIAITNSVFIDSGIRGYIYKKHIPYQKIDSNDGIDIIPDHDEIFGIDSKGSCSICNLEYLESHFGSPVYDGKWSIAGIMVNGELCELDSDNEYDE